jgi:hypothetical protein
VCLVRGHLEGTYLVARLLVSIVVTLDADDFVTMGFAFFGGTATGAVGAAHSVDFRLAALPGMLIGAALAVYLLGPLSRSPESTGQLRPHLDCRRPIDSRSLSISTGKRRDRSLSS